MGDSGMLVARKKDEFASALAGRNPVMEERKREGREKRRAPENVYGCEAGGEVEIRR